MKYINLSCLKYKFLVVYSIKLKFGTDFRNYVYFKAIYLIIIRSSWEHSCWNNSCRSLRKRTSNSNKPDRCHLRYTIWTPDRKNKFSSTC